MAVPRLCTLAINARGSWKTITTFDIDAVDVPDLLAAAVTIAQASHGESKPSLRIAIAGGESGPLMHWTSDKGWKDWKGGSAL